MVSQFCASIGKTLFFCARPTDTYESMEFGGINWKSNGADVTVVLHGNSRLEGKVWTEVVTEISNGSVKNLRFGRNNRFIEPGTKMKVTAQALASMNQEYQRQSMPSEQLRWKTLDANQTWMLWHDGNADFTVAFPGDRATNLQKTIRLKGETQSAKPDSCDQRMTYDFVQDGQQMGLTPRVWVTGTEHPLRANVLRAQEDGYGPGCPAGAAFPECCLTYGRIVGHLDKAPKPAAACQPNSELWNQSSRNIVGTARYFENSSTSMPSPVRPFRDRHHSIRGKVGYVGNELSTRCRWASTGVGTSPAPGTNFNFFGQKSRANTLL